MSAEFLPDPVVAGCSGDTCETCSDAAVEMTVLSLSGDGLALAAGSSGPEEISVALVPAKVGDTVLVHAGESIAIVKE